MRRPALALITLSLVTAVSSGGCGRGVFGVEARMRRVEGAVAARQGEAARRLALPRPPKPSLDVVRRWSAPPLLGTEFYLLRARGAAPRPSYLVALDVRALPVMLEAPPDSVARELAVPSIDWDYFNRLVHDEYPSLDRPEAALALARLAVILPAAAADPIVIGEAPTAPDAGARAQAAAQAAYPQAEPPRLAGYVEHGSVVRLWTAYRGRPGAVRWDVRITSPPAVHVSGVAFPGPALTPQTIARLAP